MRLLVQQSHVQIASGAPFAPRDVLQPRRHGHEGGLFVWEGSDHPCSPADLPVESLDGVVGADPPPAGGGESRVRQGLGVAPADGLRGLLVARLTAPVALDGGGGESHALELGHTDRHLAGLRREPRSRCPAR